MRPPWPILTEHCEQTVWPTDLNFFFFKIPYNYKLNQDTLSPSLTIVILCFDEMSRPFWKVRTDRRLQIIITGWFFFLGNIWKSISNQPGLTQKKNVKKKCYSVVGDNFSNCMLILIWMNGCFCSIIFRHDIWHLKYQNLATYMPAYRVHPLFWTKW